MNRQDLIKRLVNRKMQSAGSARRALCICGPGICICMASPKARGRPVAAKDITSRGAAQPQK